MGKPYEIVSPCPPGHFLRKMYVTFWDYADLSIEVEVLSKRILTLSWKKAENGEERKLTLTSFDGYVIFCPPPYLVVRCSVNSAITDTLRAIGIAAGGMQP